jgi:hypothetical protein
MKLDDVSTDSRLEFESKFASKDDIEIEQIQSEADDYESGPSEYEIATFPADFTLQVYADKWKDGDIEIPKFQRQFVWNQVQASKLIESFLVGLPVPSIFLYTERSSQKFLVIDGQQRLKSVIYFFEGFFGEEVKGRRTIFRLKGLSEKSKWYNKTFEDFDEIDQRRLNNSILRAFIVKQLDPNDDTSIYHIFERLNTGGTLLTNQEVRNCVYGGKFNELLIDLNSIKSWREILGKPNPDSRQKDIELILRFFALYDVEKYEKPLKDYLSKFMQKYRNPSEDFLKEKRNLFNETCNAVFQQLGQKTFHVRAGLNSSVYDSVMVAIARNLTQIPHNLRERYRKLNDDIDYYNLTSGATTDVDTVKKRFKLAENYLFNKE